MKEKTSKSLIEPETLKKFLKKGKNNLWILKLNFFSKADLEYGST